jgi:hypothetical protein
MDVVRSEPVVTSLVGALELPNDVLDVNPPVDVHLEIKLLRSVSEDEG